MPRLGAIALLLSLALSGCSLILDFSPGAIPVDAGKEAVYTQEECEYREPNDSPAEAAALAPGDVGPAAICAADPADRDFYRFTVPPSTASVAVKIMFLAADGDLELRLTDASGAMMLGQSRGFGDQEAITCPGQSPACPALGAGDYLFEVFAATGAVNRYDLALAITPL